MLTAYHLDNAMQSYWWVFVCFMWHYEATKNLQRIYFCAYHAKKLIFIMILLKSCNWILFFYTFFSYNFCSFIFLSFIKRLNQYIYKPIRLCFGSHLLDNNVFNLRVHKRSININDSGKVLSSRQRQEVRRCSSIIASFNVRKMVKSSFSLGKKSFWEVPALVFSFLSVISRMLYSSVRFKCLIDLSTHWLWSLLLHHDLKDVMVLKIIYLDWCPSLFVNLTI